MRTAMRWAGLALAAGLVLVVAVQFWYLGWIAWWKWNNPGETSFMAREEAALQQKNPKAGLRHRWVPYERISIHLKRAVITSEDARFSEHEGVDWEAIEKAYEANLKRGRPVKGGSTITQQLAKNLLLSGERTVPRKGQELLLTLMLETLLSKQRILEIYLNNVEWGEGVFGAQAAARHYFRVDAARLSPLQAARLAVMLPAPKRFEKRPGSAYVAGRAATIVARMGAVELP